MGFDRKKQIQFIIDMKMIFSKELEHGVFVNEIRQLLKWMAGLGLC